MVGPTEFASDKREESSTIYLLFDLSDKPGVVVPLVEMRETGGCLSQGNLRDLFGRVKSEMPYETSPRTCLTGHSSLLESDVQETSLARGLN